MVYSNIEMKKYKLSDQVKADITSSYKAGQTIAEIAEKYPYSRSLIHDRLLEWGVQTRKQAHVPKYTVNHNCFNELNEYSAYFFGLMAADGCVYRQEPNNRYLNMLSSNDVDILEKFNRFVGSNRPFTRDRDNYRACVTSNKIGDRLISVGITPNKSLSLEILDKKLLYDRHFLRGLVDGDGSIGINQKDEPIFHFLSGSKRMVEQLAESLLVNGICENNKLYLAQKKYYFYQRTGNSAYRIIEFLYKDCSVSINRKYEIATLILGGDAQ